MIQELEMDPLLVTPKRCALSRKWEALLLVHMERPHRMEGKLPD
jgi:hypothetical protein